MRTKHRGRTRTRSTWVLWVSIGLMGLAIAPVYAQEDCADDQDAGGLAERITAARTLPQRIELARMFVERGIQDRYRLPGMAVAVAIDGKIVWAEGFGFADREKKIPATPQTKFRVGSVSKILTAGAVALLYEQGKLDLDAPVQRYVPEFPTKGGAMTTRQLTGHLAGIRHYNESEAKVRNTRHVPDVVTALEFFKDDPLVFPPGEGHAYTSYGWTLVSAVVERAAKQPFLEYMDEKVFRPLGMKGTCADDITKDIADRAVPYAGSKRASPDYDPSFIWAGGGFLSTAEDLARFGSAFLPSAGFLKPETVQEMVTKQKTNAGREVEHGIGWFVDSTQSGDPVYYHGGMTGGGTSILLVRPKDRIAVAYAGNDSSGPDELEANAIAGIFAAAPESLVLVGSLERRKKSKAVWAEVRSTFATWMSALTSGDLSSAMSVVSDDFASPRWASKSALRSSLEAAFKKGDIAIDDSRRSMALRGLEPGSMSHVSRLTVTGPLQEGSMRMSMKWEKSGWKVVTFQADEP